MSGPTCGHGNTAAVCETRKIERLEAKLAKLAEVVGACIVQDYRRAYCRLCKVWLKESQNHLVTCVFYSIDTSAEKATSGEGCDPVCKCLKGSGIAELDCAVHGVEAKKRNWEAENEDKQPTNLLSAQCEECLASPENNPNTVNKALTAERDRLQGVLLYLSEAGPGSIAQHYREKIQAALIGDKPQKTEGLWTYGWTE